jgi:hypothetical protein
LVPKQQIAERITAIVYANPWLAGRLVRDRQTKGLVLWVPEEPCLAQNFQLVEDSALHEDIPYEELNKRVLEHSVRPSFLLLDADRPLFRVTILRGSTDCFFLTMSLTHAIADANSFYQIFRMLDTSQPISGIEPTRVQAFTDQPREAVGSTLYYSIDSRRIMLPGLRQDLFRRKKSISAALYHVKADFLAASWAIQQAMKFSKRPSRRRPNLVDSAGVQFGLVTNWAPFHHDVKLDGCHEGEHVPVLDPMAVPENTFVFYQPKKGSLAAMVVAGKKVHEAFGLYEGFRESHLAAEERGNSVATSRAYVTVRHSRASHLQVPGCSFRIWRQL